MPGSSLWLVPPEDSKIRSALQELISSDVPRIFPDLSPPDFVPHITLTSGIDPSKYSDDPQSWLESLNLSEKHVHIRFLVADTEAAYFKKCTLRVDKTFSDLDLIASESRRVGVLNGDQAAADDWTGMEYTPHCSLMYADTTVTREQLNSVSEAVTAKGVHLNGELDENAPTEKEPLDGWEGGEVWLVPTDKDIKDWQPIATRTLQGGK